MKLVGRTSELDRLREHLCGRNHLALFGVEGVGKTALILEALAGLPDTIYCGNSGTLKTACESVLVGLGRKTDARDNLHRKRAIREAMRGQHLRLVFDHVGWVGPKLLSFLDNLGESHQLIVISRSLAPSKTGHLQMILWDFAKMELQNLAHADALRLIRCQCEQFKLAIPDRCQFERDVWRLSHGNPRIILDLCGQASKGHYVFGRRLDTKLLDLDRRINQLSL